MANPYAAEPQPSDKYSIHLDEDFRQMFRAIDKAIRHGRLEQLLPHVVERKARPVNLSEDPLLSVVIAHGKSDLAIELMENMPLENLTAANFDGDTALHVAAARGDETVVAALVNKHRDLLEARNNQSEIPLHKAAHFGQGRIFWKLVGHGSNVEARTQDGSKMLHCAVMGSAPELALEIAKRHPEQTIARDARAVTPLQLMVTIPEFFRSQLHLGPLESLIYEWIPLKEENLDAKVELEELTVHETPSPRYKDDECQQYVTRCRGKFPPNYDTFFDLLELACGLVGRARLFVFNILKPLSSTIQRLEQQKKKHKKAMELIAYLAKDPHYWDFIDKGRRPQVDQTAVPEVTGILLTREIPEVDGNPPQQGKEKDQAKDSHPTRWTESPLTLGAKMGLHEFVEKILTVCPQSARYLDAEGRNVLQVAIQHGHEKIVDIIKSMASGNNPVLPSWLLSRIDQKTKNTILHFAAEKTVREEAPALQMQLELQWFERVNKLVREDMKYSRNVDEKTAQELFTENRRKTVERGKQQLTDMGKTCSGLVAAVVFASSFSIPGEKDANNNPVFLHKTAFKVFSHAYVLGLSCAATALVLFLSLLTSSYREKDFRRSLPTKYFFANLSFFLALVAFLVAFSCNIYLNIYGGRKAETKDIVPFVCELTIFPTVCISVLLYRGYTFGLGSFFKHVWR